MDRSRRWAGSYTRLTVDYLYSHFRNESINYQVGSVGLNRNNTSNVYNTMTAASPIATKRGLYPNACTAVAEGLFTAPLDCGATLYGTTPALAKGSDGNAAVLGTNIFSVNPFNLDPYDYYNNPLSPGYMPSAIGVAGRAQLIGRPAVKVLDAHVTNGVADYLKLSNVDWRDGADGGFYTTDFNQVSVNLDHRFSDTFKMNAVLGLSKSTNVYEGKLVEFNAMDVAGPMIYDERGNPTTMPTFNPGFDVANPANWGIVKGFSAMRHYLRHTQTTYAQGKVDFDWVLNDTYEFKFGGNIKQFGFYTDQFERNNDSINPTEREAGLTSVASLGAVHAFGQGLDLPAGTPTSFFAPNFDAFSALFGFDCSCINKYGDFRITIKRNNTATFGVDENDSGYYGQVNFKYTIFGSDLDGNLGVRLATTDVRGRGRTNAGRPLEETNHYTDTLPSLNLNWHVMHNLYMRVGASKAMARPLLGNLSPSVSAISIPNTTGATTGGSLTVGNTQLKPFRSTNYDWDVEWYFDKNALLSFALFDKEVRSFPQTILFDSKLSDFLDQDSIDAVKANLSTTNPTQLAAQIAYIDGNQPFTARQVRDAPGGSLWGWELNYQQELTFLPSFGKNFGIQLNATHIGSKLKYIIDPGVKTNGVYCCRPAIASRKLCRCVPKSAPDRSATAGPGR
jgi:TonB-dependent receptor